MFVIKDKYGYYLVRGNASRQGYWGKDLDEATKYEIKKEAENSIKYMTSIELKVVDANMEKAKQVMGS